MTLKSQSSQKVQQTQPLSSFLLIRNPINYTPFRPEELLLNPPENMKMKISVAAGGSSWATHEMERSIFDLFQRREFGGLSDLGVHPKIQI